MEPKLILARLFRSRLVWALLGGLASAAAVRLGADPRQAATVRTIVTESGPVLGAEVLPEK